MTLELSYGFFLAMVAKDDGLCQLVTSWTHSASLTKKDHYLKMLENSVSISFRVVIVRLVLS